jgi:flagellar capping protein FliD
MVTSINLGGISEQNGRTVVSGTSSGGIDTEALLEGLTAARRLPAVQLEERITSNETVSTKYGELQEILRTFQDASDFLRNPPGVGNQDENIFEYRTSTLGGNTSGATSNYLSVSAQPGADVSSYDVTIDQLATYNTKITDTFALADADTDAVGAGLPFNAGTFSIGATGVDVTLDADDTLNQVVAKINAVSDESFVRASVIQVSDGQYRMSLKTTQTGAEYNYDLVDTYRQSGNEIVIEAEDFQGQTDRGGFTYSVVADAAASDGEYIESGPDTVAFYNANIEINSPQTDYHVRFDESGTYYVWVLGRGTANDDSLHMGLDGVVQNTTKDMFGGDSTNPTDFVWRNGNLNDNPSRFEITEAGVYDINVFMREDGHDLDKIILTTDAAFVPAGNAQVSTLQQTSSIFNVAFAVDEDAQDAQMTIDGTAVTRSNNAIDDVIEDVTFNLLAETGAGEEITANIGADTEIAKAAIINFVDSYNEFRIFAAEQIATDEDGAPTEDAVLASSSTLRTILSRVNAEVATVVDGIAGGNYDRLADIGLNFTDFQGNPVHA